MRSGKTGLAISENANRTAATQLQLLLSKARSVALQTSDTVAGDVIQELCSTIDSLQTTQAEVRREAFRDAVRGIAGAIRKDQVPAAVPWAQDLPGPYASNEELASELERAHAAEPITIAELRQFRLKLKSAEEGTPDIDDAVKRIYYAALFERSPTTEAILPPGSPSHSIDLAALIIQRILPNGWWTMGNSGENLADLPVAKVGTWTGDNPKAETSPTPPLALLSALALTLIEAAKKDA